MASIRIKVGASLDANALTVFAPLEKAAARAAKTISKELNTGAKGMGPYRTNAREAGAAIEGLGKTAKQQADAMVKDVERSARERVRLEKQAMREIERELARSSKVREKAESGGGGGGNRFGNRVGYWSMRNFSPVTPTLSVGKRIAGDLARGAGVETDVSSYVNSFVNRQKLATDISNSGFIPSATGANATRVNAGDLMQQASSVGLQTASDPTKVLEGLQKFVALTGDLQTGRALLKDMAVLSRATGSNMDEVVTAAGEIAGKLPEGTDKVQALNTLMKQLAGAGKLSAIEMRDLAAQMGAVAAVAPQFEGKVEDNVATLGVLMQVARQSGGAKTAAQASTSVMSFANLFSKGARTKEFMAITGRSFVTEKGQMRDPEELILEALKGSEKKAGGIGNANFGLNMGKIFSDVRARTAVRGFEAIYRDAGGGKAGLEAVHNKFQEIKAAKIGDKELGGSFAASMNTAEAKVQIFNNKMQAIADNAAGKLLPALEKLAPSIERAAGAFGDFLVWATDNPGKAVATALGVSIAKAGIEQTIRLGIEKGLPAAASLAASLMKSGAQKGLDVLGSSSPAAAGLAATLAIASIAVTAMYVDSFFTQKEKEVSASVGSDIEANNLINKISATGSASKDELAALQRYRDSKKNEREKARTEDLAGGGLETIIGAAAYATGQGESMEAAQKQRVANQEQTLRRLSGTIERLDMTLGKFGKAPLDVRQVGGGVQANPSGTMPANSPKP